MFTVKWIAPSGEENLSEHLAVIADRTETDGRPRVLVFDELPNASKTNHSGIFIGYEMAGVPVAPDTHRGRVYVMNRFGATVAKYDL